MKAWVAVATLCCVVSAQAWAADEPAPTPSSQDTSMTVTKRGGTRFLTRSGWPFTQKNNIVTPMPLEEYLIGKLTEMNDQLRRMEQQLDAMERRLTQIENDRKAVQTRLQLLEGSLPAAQATREGIHGDTTQERKAPVGAQSGPQAGR